VAEGAGARGAVAGPAAPGATTAGALASPPSGYRARRPGRAPGQRGAGPAASGSAGQRLAAVAAQSRPDAADLPELAHGVARRGGAAAGRAAGGGAGGVGAAGAAVGPG